MPPRSHLRAVGGVSSTPAQTAASCLPPVLLDPPQPGLSRSRLVAAAVAVSHLPAAQNTKGPQRTSRTSQEICP